jgi:hypothetical protein
MMKMTQKELFETLDRLFIERYSKTFAELNKNIYTTALEEGTFEVPVPTLGLGGGTLALGSPESLKLEPPAVVKVQHKRMEAANAIYRIAMPRYECEVAASKPEYFNYLFDSSVNKAIVNYNSTFGGPDKVRFGTTYCTYLKPGNSETIFADLDGGDYLEFRLFGQWASDKEVTKVNMGEVVHE